MWTARWAAADMPMRYASVLGAAAHIGIDQDADAIEAAGTGGWRV